MRRIVAQPSLLPLYIIVEQKRKRNAKKYNTTRAARFWRWARVKTGGVYGI